MNKVHDKMNVIFYSLEDDIFNFLYDGFYPKRQEDENNYAFEFPWSQVHLVIQDRVDNSALGDVIDQLFEELHVSSLSDL